MTPSEVGAVCRLCTKTSELLWVFNDKIKTSENFKDVIAITTGVEINKDDGPSQFVCKKCLECAIRMYQFRIKAQNSNKLVIDQYEERSKKLATPPVSQTAQVKIHPSVTALLNIYPTINVPSSILKKNLSPLISLPMNYVEDYFRTRNLDMDEAVRCALRSMRTKRPKNPSVPKPIKAKDRNEKSPKPEGIDSKPGLISPINIKVNSTEPSYEIVKKHPDKNGKQPKITEKEDFTESLGLLPIKSNKIAPTHEKKESVQRTIPADVSRKDKPGIKRKKKKETLFEKSLQLLNRMQQSMKRPGSCEPPAKKQKIENPATAANMKETEQGDEVIQPMEQNGEKSTNIAKLAEASYDESKLDSAEAQENKKDLQKVDEPIISTPPPETAESPKNFDGPIELTIEKQEQCYMCHVCNATEFDRRGLKRHMLGHMRCPFCKKKFKSFESADEHIRKVCPISTSMKNLPDVCLSRVELDDDLRRKYPLAFEEFFPPKLENVDNEVIIAETKEQNPEKFVKTGDVIEILSDDEDATSKTPQNVMKVVDISQVKQPVNVGSCSIITPSIGLKNSRHNDPSLNLLSRDSRTEQQMLKALLSRSRRNDVSSSTQTFMPGDVISNKESNHIRLIGLKAQLHVNKIPLTIRNGPFFLKLRKSLPKPNPCPQLMKWDDLTPCDIVETATTPSSLATNALTPMEKAGKRMVLDAPAKVPSPTAANAAQTILAPTYIPSVIVNSSTKSSTNPMPTAPVLNSVIVATFNNPPFNSVAVEKPSTAPNTEATSAVARCPTAKESLPVPTQALVSPSYEASIAGKLPPLISLSSHRDHNIVTTSTVTKSTVTVVPPIPKTTEATIPKTAEAVGIPKSNNNDSIKATFTKMQPMPSNGLNLVTDKEKYKNGVQLPQSSYRLLKTSAPSPETRQIVLNSLIKMPPVDKVVPLPSGTLRRVADLSSPVTTIHHYSSTQDQLKYRTYLNQFTNPNKSVDNTTLRVYRKTPNCTTTTSTTTSILPFVLNGSVAADISGTAAQDEVMACNMSVAGTGVSASSEDTPVAYQKAVSEAPKVPTSTVMPPGAIRVKDVWELK